MPIESGNSLKRTNTNYQSLPLQGKPFALPARQAYWSGMACKKSNLKVKTLGRFRNIIYKELGKVGIQECNIEEHHHLWSVDSFKTEMALMNICLSNLEESILINIHFL